MIALLWFAGGLTPYAYVGLLAGSSLMSAWGNAGQYTLLSELGGPAGRLAVNSLLLLGRPRKAPQEHPEPAAATSPGG